MATSDREYVIELVGKITRLREELKAAEGELDRVLTYPASPILETPQPPVFTFSAPLEMSMAQKIVALLAENPTKDFDAGDVQCAIGGELPSIRSALARLSEGENSKIMRANRGTYRIRPFPFEPIPFPIENPTQ